MIWKTYRITQLPVATGNLDGKRRVIMLLDGRVLIEREGGVSRIVDAPFGRALAICETEPRAGEERRVHWFKRFRLWLGALIAGDPV